MIFHMNLEDFELIYKDDRVEIKDKKKLKTKLIDILGEHNVSDDEVDIFAYSRDAPTTQETGRCPGNAW